MSTTDKIVCVITLCGLLALGIWAAWAISKQDDPFPAIRNDGEPLTVDEFERVKEWLKRNRDKQKD